MLLTPDPKTVILRMVQGYFVATTTAFHRPTFQHPQKFNFVWNFSAELIVMTQDILNGGFSGYMNPTPDDLVLLNPA
jgi:hypothetical protein